MGLGHTALVIGGSRGLGNALVQSLVKRGLKVFVTIRGSHSPTSNSESGDDGTYPEGVIVLEGVDLSNEKGCEELEKGIRKSEKSAGSEVVFDLVIYSAGVLNPDSIENLSWEDHVAMYSTCSIAPVFLISRLLKMGALDLPLKAGETGEGKVLIITSEGGSIALRTKEEGGGNYGHHGSKVASNMIGRLLSLDLSSKGYTVVNIHPGFMKTDMTHGAGFSQYYESGGAVEPPVAADSLLDFASTVEQNVHGGGFWAPRGPRDIGEAERVMGKNLPTPLELPW